MQLLDGKRVADYFKANIKEAVAALPRPPHLAAIWVGNDGGSTSYIKNKIASCQAVGFDSTLLHFDDSISEAFLLEQVQQLNQAADIDGFIVQLPLPPHINAERVNLAIAPAKDVDGFHPVNVGRMMLDMPCYLPATPQGIMEMLKFYDIPTAGKHCVIVGRSNIVGTPMSILMSRNKNFANATVTLCHSRTQNLTDYTRAADILIVAMGKPEWVGADMIKEGAVVIDVGSTYVPASDTKSGVRLKGDVNFEQVAQKAAYLTPVPGGVGQMTVAMLLLNTLRAAKGEVYDK
ncbi:MAG: bifunctional 5,10-methylenetetrahydrofolate dehydrogenase/5,10-methenyltetrahydrofolate cyclohydrolase [Sphingobacteriales bacterium]|nr:bifunctional 5,10-methylenetetrahydrofolate dehydrogenase/5,10-methenyltetrahydrofolate cyclohydrolase [Sphingobacteriales bacterium]